MIDLLRALLRPEAERRANQLHRALFGRAADGERLQAWTEAHLDILCDLSDPDSRAIVARLVAARLGWDVGSVILAVENGGQRLVQLCGNAGVPHAHEHGNVEALRLIALAVLGAPS